MDFFLIQFIFKFLLFLYTFVDFCYADYLLRYVNYKCKKKHLPCGFRIFYKILFYNNIYKLFILKAIFLQIRKYIFSVFKCKYMFIS